MDNKAYSVSLLAKNQSVPTNTIRNRKSRGWTDAEIIAGRKERKSKSPAESVPYNDFPEGLNTSNQLSMLRKPEGLLPDSRNTDFYRMAHLHQYLRSSEGEEYFPVMFDELLEICPEDVGPSCRETSERRFARVIWPAIKYHVLFRNLKPAQQKFLEKIDPEYVAQQKSTTGK